MSKSFKVDSTTFDLGQAQALPFAGAVIKEVRGSLANATGSGAVTAKRMQNIAMESLGDQTQKTKSQQGLVDVYDNIIKPALEALQVEPTRAAQQMATLTANYAAAPGRYAETLGTNKASGGVSIEGFNTTMQLSDAARGAMHALENFTDQTAHEVVPLNVSYALGMASPDALTHAILPPLVIPADQAGYLVKINIPYVASNVPRALNGAAYDPKRRMLMRAYADRTILSTNDTKIHGVWRADRSANLVDPAVIGLPAVTIEGVSTQVAAFKPNVKSDIVANSFTQGMLARGAASGVDKIDRYFGVEQMFWKFGAGATANMLNFPIKDMHGAMFVPAIEGFAQDMLLSFNSASFVINATTVQHNQTPLAGDLAKIVTNDWEARVEISLSGSCNLDSSNALVRSDSIRLVSLVNPNTSPATVVDTATGDGAAILAAINAATFEGWVPNGNRLNFSLRQLGDWIDADQVQIQYTVGIGMPLHTKRPVQRSAAEEGAAVANLIEAVKVRLHNDTNRKIQDTFAQLKTITGMADGSAIFGRPTMGAGSMMVIPYAKEQPLDLTTLVQGTNSSERWNDINAAILGVVALEVQEAVRKSQLLVAGKAFYGPGAEKPKVYLITDPTTAGYLMRVGDNRLISEYEYEVISTPDTTYLGEIYIVFGRADIPGSGNFSPLHAGNTAMRPDLIVSLPMNVDGATVHSYVVHPQYTQFWNLPVMVRITIAGLQEVVGKKVYIPFKTVQ